MEQIGRMGKLSERARSWVFLSLLAIVAGSIIFVYYRHRYDHDKRVRVVDAGKFYRGGLLTASGFTKLVSDYKIKTIINLMDEAPDPKLDGGPVESEFCKQQGVRFVYIPPALAKGEVNNSINQFLAICDDAANFPIYIHCKAGLHRTGTLSALYRIEYNDWSLDRALKELVDCGFSPRQATWRNEYVDRYLLSYTPRKVSTTMTGAVTLP